MPSTFFGLTIASSGLSAYQVALNTSANNISNVQTKGYSKQQANRVASESIRAYAKYGSMGTVLRPSLSNSSVTSIMTINTGTTSHLSVYMRRSSIT